jgi:hypothetical protein
MQCAEDIRAAAQAPIHLIVGETGYPVPGAVPDEATKAKATVAEFETFARAPYVDGASYANIDECDLYPSGYFVGTCLVDSLGTKLPAFGALQALAKAEYL